jgi:hypothetical protein
MRILSLERIVSVNKEGSIESEEVHPVIEYNIATIVKQMTQIMDFFIFMFYTTPTIMHHPERGVASDRVDALVL